MNRRGKQARLLTNGIIGVSTDTTLGDEYWNDVTLLLDGSSATNDASSAGNNVTNYNNGATITSVTGPFEYTQNVISFDGTNDYLEDTTIAALGTDDWTIETWVKFDNFNDSYSRIWEIGYYNASGGFRLNQDNTTKKFYIQDANPGNSSTGTTVLSVNVWYHLAVTRSGDIFRFYINGSLEDSFTSSSYNITETKFRIGGGYTRYGDDTPNNYTAGDYVDFRITKGVARYTANFTPPTASLPTNAPIFGRRGVGTEATLRTRGYVGAAADGAIDPAEHFKAVTWTGDNGTNRGITGVGFEPDFVWLKNRTDSVDTGSNHMVFDVVRGATKYLQTDNVDQEETNASSLKSFDAGGFTVGNLQRTNTSGKDYVAWCLKAGGTGVSNTDGSITSTVSANVDAGFSIVTYTGNGGTADVGHGLSAKPELIMTKMTAQNSGASSTSQWIVHHDGLSGNVASDNPWSLYLNGSDIEQDLAAFGAYGKITSSKFRVSRTSTFSAHNNNNNSDYVAYCFHSVPGFSKVGSYTGDGTTSNYIETGFRPAFVMIKNTGRSQQDWHIIDGARDTTNPRSYRLKANTFDAESTTDNACDFNDNGFTLVSAPDARNRSGDNYIYLAFAESNTLSDPNVGMLTLYDRYVDALT